DYFKSINSDNKLFESNDVKKTLGLLSFFYTIDLKDRDKILKITSDFGIQYDAFIESIYSLNQKELITIQYEIAKISEQVLAYYFFYKIFIKEELLSFETLLFNYYL